MVGVRPGQDLLPPQGRQLTGIPDLPPFGQQSR
jgi:hypothetical protein